MKKLVRRRPSPALIIAVIALIAALGGTAMASGVLTTKKFKSQAVRGPLTYATTTVNVPNTIDGTLVSVSCPAGTHVTGGGIKVSDEENMYVNDSHPTSAGWAGTVYNGNTGATPATVTAICATVKSVSGAPPSS
jgi:hypothetical protein